MQGRNNRIITYSWILDLNYIVVQLWKCYSDFHGIVVCEFCCKNVWMYHRILSASGRHTQFSSFHSCRVLVFFSPIWYFKNILTEWVLYIYWRCRAFSVLLEYEACVCVCGLAFCKSVISPGHLEIKVSLLAKDVLIINHFSAVILIF